MLVTRPSSWVDSALSSWMSSPTPIITTRRRIDPPAVVHDAVSL